MVPHFRRIIWGGVFVLFYIFNAHERNARSLQFQSLEIESSLIPQKISAQESTVPLEFLWHLYNSIPRKFLTSTLFRKVSYIRARQSSVLYEDVTLVTQISTNKFRMLSELADGWNGPISCAVYLQGEASIQKFFSLVQEQNQNFHKMVTLHVMIERPYPGALYPINHLRNLALDNIDTEYFFYVDADFRPSYACHDYLKDFFAKNDDPKRFSTLYVVPAFEMAMKGRDVTSFPTVKSELMKLLSSGKAQGFHMDYFAPGHGSTNFEHWYECQPQETYPIKYQFMFEPYVVGSRHGLHRFDDRLRGYGLNKWVWIAEASFNGYSFQTLCGAFVIHVHEKRASLRNFDANVIQLQDWYEKIYWPNRYNITGYSEKKLTSVDALVRNQH